MRFLINLRRRGEAVTAERRLLQVGRILQGTADRSNAPELFGGVALDSLIPGWLRIRNRRGELVDLRPNAAQQQFARRRGPRNIILKARQLGMTTYIAARFFVATLLRPGTATLQVAHSFESSHQISRIVQRFLRTLRPAVGRIVKTERWNQREIVFASLDSRYIIETAGNLNAGRGLTVHNLHASEVALWPGDAQETMAALLASVPPHGEVEIESTPRGVGGYFHTEWLRSTDGRSDGNLTPHFFPWWIEPEYSLPLLPGERLIPFTEDERRLMEREGLCKEQIKFRRHLRQTFGDMAPQEFAESPAECFLLSGRPVFDSAAIEARLQQLPVPVQVRNNAAEMVWYAPQPGRRYVIGADVAEGVAAGDYSAAVVIDAETGLQCAEIAARWLIHRFAEELARLGRQYNTALIAVERNNQGHAVLYALEHTFAYPRIYRHREGDNARRGWPMNAQTKPFAIGVLTQMLRDAPSVFVSLRLLEQCRNFAYNDAGAMGGRPGTHDDLVMAMAIALAVRAQAGDPQLFSASL